MTPYKTETGRLLEAGVLQIHRLRDAFAPDGSPKSASKDWTLQKIATELGLSLGTVHNICKGKTHPDLHPSRPLFWQMTQA